MTDAPDLEAWAHSVEEREWESFVDFVLDEPVSHEWKRIADRIVASSGRRVAAEPRKDPDLKIAAETREGRLHLSCWDTRDEDDRGAIEVKRTILRSFSDRASAVAWVRGGHARRELDTTRRRAADPRAVTPIEEAAALARGEAQTRAIKAMLGRA
jgi:hypothetical protein